MKAKFILLLLVAPILASAGTINPYEWEQNRKRYSLTPEESEKAEYVIKNHIQYDYVLEDNQFLMYATVHKIVLVNNNDAIEKNNRIVISMHNTIELADLRARAISKEGKVVNFDKNNIKEIKDEDTDKSYRIFAIEGIENGSEVEYFFTRKMYAFLFDRTFVQTDVPTREVSFVLSCPSHLQFDFRSYNGFPEVAKSPDEERNVYKASANNVKAMREEPFSYYNANRQRIEFKLAYNTARSKARLNTWEDAAKNFYSRLTKLEKEEEKALDKFYSSLNDKKSDKTEVRVKNIEQKLKTSIRVDENARGESAGKLNEIIKNRIAGREGMTRLMLNVYERAGIKVYPVLTCDREQSRFDGSFDTWDYLDEYLLYFPDTDGFLAPYSFEHRYPFVPTEFTATDGLFVEPILLGTVKSALASVKAIPATPHTVNFNNLDIRVTFNDDFSNNQVRKIENSGGYNALFFTPYLPLMTKENKLEMVQSLIKSSAPDADITTWKAEQVNNDKTEEFVVDIDFKTSHFLEKAGPRLLFKVGELIGPQTEMYRDDERITPVENDYNRLYDRKIHVTIPEGYTIKNPGDLNFNVVYKDGEKQPFAFISSYTIKGNLLEVLISEYYEDIRVPLDRYEDFRKVINAAADFNKVTLVLEKK